jgi:hypothetical protein
MFRAESAGKQISRQRVAEFSLRKSEMVVKLIRILFVVAVTFKNDDNRGSGGSR